MIKAKTLHGLLAGLLLISCASQAQESLLLVESEPLLNTPPSETLLGQSIWEMHRNSLSRTSLIRLNEASPAVSHADGERTLIILKGSVDFSFANGHDTLTAGDYIAIAPNQPYRMAPKAGSSALLLGFDVPIIDMHQARLSDNRSATSAPVIKKQKAVMASPPGWNDPSDRGWTLVKTADKRVNLVEMFSELQNHSHPDADHSLILLRGSARVVTPQEERVLKPGDYLSIPKNMPHKYYVDGDQPALFISFDAPAYDPAKTLFFK
jgi:quercetin dioxygenase-like cupin family protein